MIDIRRAAWDLDVGQRPGVGREYLACCSAPRPTDLSVPLTSCSEDAEPPMSFENKPGNASSPRSVECGRGLVPGTIESVMSGVRFVGLLVPQNQRLLDLVLRKAIA